MAEPRDPRSQPDPPRPDTGAATDPSSDADDTARSQPLSADEARGLVLGLERHGVETDNIIIETEAPREVGEVSAVDQASVRRPVRRALAGALLGAAIGLALSAGASAVWDLPGAPVLVTGGIIGALLGALWTLYGTLEASTEVRDADSGGPTVVSTKVGDMSGTKTDQVRRLTDQANPDR